MHVAGSPAADTVRDYLVDTLTDLGLRAEVQDAVGADDALGGYAMARVRNVVALLPGTDPTGRVFLVAHYDSVQVSYGGNDDGAGVATLLETARALTAGPAPRNDIVFVLTDAEEACLCGAEAFVSQHRYAADGGVVLNFEARGSTGPAIMFETSRGNAGVVDLYGDAVPDPVGTSFAVEVYRILPNDTDFTPFREQARFVGLNSAYIDGSAVYHTPEDTAGQHGPGQPAAPRRQRARPGPRLRRAPTWAPSAARRRSTRPTSRCSACWCDYPGWLVWPFAAAALVAVVGAGRAGPPRAALTTVGRLAAGFGLGLVPLLVAPGAGPGAVVRADADPARATGEMIDPWQPGWFRDCVLALVAVTVLLWYGLLRRRIGPWALVIGAFAWLAVLGARPRRRHPGRLLPGRPAGAARPRWPASSR